MPEQLLFHVTCCEQYLILLELLITKTCGTLAKLRSYICNEAPIDILHHLHYTPSETSTKDELCCYHLDRGIPAVGQLAVDHDLLQQDCSCLPGATVLHV